MGDLRNTEATGNAAWFNANSEGRTRPVGQRPLGDNVLNLFDLSGNVWEWNFGWHPEAVNSLRVVRGGSWYLPAEYLRIAELGSYHPGYVSSGVGFRIARSMNYERIVR